MAKPYIEMRSEFEGEKFTIVVNIHEDRVMISNGDNGGDESLSLSLDDFDKVAVEVARFRRADLAAQDGNATVPEE